MDYKNTLAVNGEDVAVKPKTGQSAPTTTTVGYIGKMIVDTDGNEWKCLNTPMTTWNQTANYIWALADKDMYPALNTEYISHYCTRLSKLVYRMARETTTASAGGLVSTAHGITGFSRLYDQANVFMINSTGNNNGNYSISATDYFLGTVNATNCTTIIPNAPALNSRPVYFKFKYIKG